MNVINEKVTALIDEYYRPLNDRLGEFRRSCDDVENLIILKETELFLRSYLSLLRPRCILEIGTCHAYSAIFFAELLPGAVIDTIERRADFTGIAEDNVRRFGLEERIRIHNGDGTEVMGELRCCGKRLAAEPYGFVFLDGAKSHYRDFFEAAEPLCSRDTVFICDNIMMDAILVDPAYDNRRRHRTSVKRMHEFLGYIDERSDLELTLLSTGDGLAIINYK